MTSISLNGLFHFILKSRFRAELPNHRSGIQLRFPNVRRHGWEHLFKTRSDLVRQFAPGFERIRRLMLGSCLLVLQPEDLGSIASGRSLEEELFWTMERYQMDSNDAAILIEAQRAGVNAIASSDADFQRALIVYDIYTWGTNLMY